MLVGFIGCPSSGKTTTAALVFAELKELGFAAEFIPEQARLVIARKRVSLGKLPNESLDLDIHDQEEILLRQREAETLMTTSTGRTVVCITDSSIYNTFLYGASLDSVRVYPYDLLFYSAPVEMAKARDPNRVHDRKQSLAVNEKIPKMIQTLGLEPITLVGSSADRKRKVVISILEYLSE